MITVLAVVGALMAILSPRVFLYVEDAKQIQARGDVRQIAAAIHSMYKDTRRWPFYKDGQGTLTYSSGTDPGILTSHALCRGEALAPCLHQFPKMQPRAIRGALPRRPARASRINSFAIGCSTWPQVPSRTG